MPHGYGAGSTTFRVLPIETALNFNTIDEVTTQRTERQRRMHSLALEANRLPMGRFGSPGETARLANISSRERLGGEVGQLNARIGELETLRTSSGTAANSAADLLAQQPELRALTREAERSRAGRRDDTRRVAPGPSRDSGAQRTSEGRRATRGAPRRKRGRAARLIGGLGMPGTGSEILG